MTIWKLGICTLHHAYRHRRRSPVDAALGRETRTSLLRDSAERSLKYLRRRMFSQNCRISKGFNTAQPNGTSHCTMNHAIR
jgi:hypothetical protein